MLPQVKIKADILEVIRRIPAGRIATHGQIGAHLGISPVHIAAMMAAMDDADRATAPWWRVVADGGAIGRHAGRDAQMKQLRAEGVVVAPVGIVQELSERRVRSLAAPQPGAPLREEPALPSHPLSRSRGMKGRPTSTV
jgi:methylated-DNA-protein-cysteine methyltransferase related protein